MGNCILKLPIFKPSSIFWFFTRDIGPLPILPERPSGETPLQTEPPRIGYNFDAVENIYIICQTEINSVVNFQIGFNRKLYHIL